MELRPHPSHDRDGLRRMIAGFALIVLAALGCCAAQASGAGEWLKWFGGAGMLAGFGIILRTPVNICRCPSCGELLRRGHDNTEFPCQRCGVIWVTRSYGWNRFE
jgi:hypothetical protein